MKCNEKPGADNGPSDSRPEEQARMLAWEQGVVKGERRAAMIAAGMVDPAKPTLTDATLAQNVRRAWDALVDAMDAAEAAGMTLRVPSDEAEAYDVASMRRAGLRLEISQATVTYY